jgi:hypothetical protein
MSQNSDQLDAQINRLGGPGLADNVVGPEPTHVQNGKP